MDQPAKRPEIVAYGVRNLTDARYFSAMGVQWMGFPLGMESGIPLEQIAGIIDWVEGPKYFVEVSRAQHMDIPDILQMLNVDAVMTEGVHQASVIQHLQTKVSDLAAIPEGMPGQALFIDFLHEDTAQRRLIDDPVLCGYLRHICANRPVWVGMQWDTSTLADLLAGIAPAALVIDAGDEEVVGVKSYEEIDKLFELLG